MLLSEYILGRGTQSEAVTAYKKLHLRKQVGLGLVVWVCSAVFIIKFYSVVGVGFLYIVALV